MKLKYLLIIFLACVLFAPYKLANANEHNPNEYNNTSDEADGRKQKRIITLTKLHNAKLISDALYNRTMRQIQAGSNNTPAKNHSFTVKPAQSSSTRQRYVALIIGNNEYQHFESLDTAINDATAIGSVLRDRYGFEVQLLKNATRRELFIALAKWQNRLTENDNFLLYYAGHGYHNPQTNRGYWFPSDAERQNSSNWISTIDISDALLAMPARDVLVIADSCFSSSLATTGMASGTVRPVPSQNVRYATSRARSRSVITSGGLEPVLDSIDGEHSVFAQALLYELSTITESPQTGQLFNKVLTEVTRRVSQTPGYFSIASAGHQQGEFTFPTPVSAQ